MMRAINVRRTDKIIIYDRYHNISAPRTWFMLKCMGVENVWVLNGTYDKYCNEGHRLDRMQTENALKRVRQDTTKEGDFNFKLDTSKIRKFDEIQKIVKQNEAEGGGSTSSSSSNPVMLDGRLSKYFDRAHIPTSRSLPLDAVMDEKWCFLPREQLIEVFKKKGGLADPQKDPVILTCQRGITACIVNFALQIIGNTNTSVYDGSLEEYAEKTGMKI